MTIHKALHPRDDDDRLYVSRKEGGRRFYRIENIGASIRRREEYKEKCRERLITATRNNSDIRSSNRMTITRKNGKKQLN